MTELASLVVFCLLAVVILGTALGVVLSNNLVHSALLMTACFIGVGIMYITLEADFLGAVEFMPISSVSSLICGSASITIPPSTHSPCPCCSACSYRSSG